MGVQLGATLQRKEQGWSEEQTVSRVEKALGAWLRIGQCSIVRLREPRVLKGMCSALLTWGCTAAGSGSSPELRTNEYWTGLIPKSCTRHSNKKRHQNHENRVGKGNHETLTHLPASLTYLGSLDRLGGLRYPRNCPLLICTLALPLSKCSGKTLITSRKLFLLETENIADKFVLNILIWTYIFLAPFSQLLFPPS